MKSRRGLIIIVVLVSLGILALLFLLDNSGGGNNSAASNAKPGDKDTVEKKKNNWQKKYGYRNIDPYGTFIFYQLLKTSSAKKVSVLKRSSQYQFMDTVKNRNKLYMYIATNFPDNRFHINRVLNMVKEGNSAFISAEVFPPRFWRMINRTHLLHVDYDSSMTSYFVHPGINDSVGIKFNFKYKNQKIKHYWPSFRAYKPVVVRICYPGSDTLYKVISIGEFLENQIQAEYDPETEEEDADYDDEDDEYSDDSDYDETAAQVQPYINDKADSLFNLASEEQRERLKKIYADTVDVYAVNANNDVQFMSFRYGKGRLYLHTIPYSFTNVVMLNKLGLRNAENVVSCLPLADMYYDNYVSSVVSQSANNGNDEKGIPTRRTSPLQFILSERSFRWAWYILLATVFLYILFRGKRKQKIIPPVATQENDHLEFSSTLSKLYIQRGEPRHIVHQQERNLQFFIRRKYYINITRNPTEDEMVQLARKSGVDMNVIKQIYTKFHDVRTGKPTGLNEVTHIYQQLEFFYKNCR